MNHVRWHQLMKDSWIHRYCGSSLTPSEIAEGWHFCYEFDGLLVKRDPNMLLCGQACIEGESNTKLTGCSTPGCGYPDGKPCIRCGHVEPKGKE